VPGVGGPAEAVPAHDLAVEAPAAQVAAGLAGVGRGEQALVVPLDGPLDRVVQLLPAPPALPLGGVGVAQGDAGPGRQPLDRAGEVEVLDLPDEGDGVAGFLATEAVEEPLLAVDAEAGRLLGVERAQG